MILDQIYDILVQHAGASEYWRKDFVLQVGERDCKEYRFQGSLGFGGKFRPERWSVDCYKEDETPERLAAIKTTNEALKALYEKTLEDNIR